MTAISIPDFSSTPGAAPFGTRQALLGGIDAFNAIAREEALRRSLEWIDLTEISRAGAAGVGWTAEDGLHPSDAQYQAWAGWIWERLGAAWVEAAS